MSKHVKRDARLPAHREGLLKNAVTDLRSDPDVVGIYLSGSLAKGNADHYSDIDLHVIVTSESKGDFINEKRERSGRWGDVLFYEGVSSSPVIVTHYECFVKIDCWYHAPEEVVPSLWLKGSEVLYDPHALITEATTESEAIHYQLLNDEVEFWRGKVLSFIHETYRAVKRNEIYYAYTNFDRIRWLITYGWYMELGEHLDGSYGVWSKIESERGKLQEPQLSLLKQWNCNPEPNDMLDMIDRMIPEFIRLNKVLSDQVGIESDEARVKKAIDQVF